MGDVILCWHDYADERRGFPGSITEHREPTYPDYLARLWERYHDGQWTPADLPGKPAIQPTVKAYVNHGRWCVACDCGQAVSPAEPGQDYLCPVCEQWTAVAFPENRAEIEAMLLELPGNRLTGAFRRNWRPS